MHEKHIYVNEKWSNENKIGIYKRIEVKKCMKSLARNYSQNVKHGSFFCIFCWWQQKIGHSITKMFSLTHRILISAFRKRYGLLDSELTLARY